MRVKLPEPLQYGLNSLFRFPAGTGSGAQVEPVFPCREPPSRDYGFGMKHSWVYRSGPILSASRNYQRAIVGFSFRALPPNKYVYLDVRPRLDAIWVSPEVVCCWGGPADKDVEALAAGRGSRVHSKGAGGAVIWNLCLGC